jgi:NADH-quinone oxidoreductase subunit B
MDENVARPYGDEKFLDAEQEMTRMIGRASDKYKVETNAIFAKLGEATKAWSSGMVNWGMANSMWPLQFGLACCAMELMGFGASRIDAERRGYLIFRGTPKQCDVMIVAGWVTKSIAPRVRRLYEQMASPRHVIAFGECATSGGPWWESYNIIQGIDQVLPVDVYVVGCPPKPENLFGAMMKLQDKVGGKIVGNSERSISENTRRNEAAGI